MSSPDRYPVKATAVASPGGSLACITYDEPTQDNAPIGNGATHLSQLNNHRTPLPPRVFLIVETAARGLETARKSLDRLLKRAQFGLFIAMYNARVHICGQEHQERSFLKAEIVNGPLDPASIRPNPLLFSGKGVLRVNGSATTKHFPDNKDFVVPLPHPDNFVVQLGLGEEAPVFPSREMYLTQPPIEIVRLLVGNRKTGHEERVSLFVQGGLKFRHLLEAAQTIIAGEFEPRCEMHDLVFEQAWLDRSKHDVLDFQRDKNWAHIEPDKSFFTPGLLWYSFV